MSSRLNSSVEIVGQGWTLHLPTGNRYDREVLFDHLREVVDRHGTAQLKWSSGSASIAKAPKQAAKKCSSCHGPADRIVGTSSGDHLCLGCIWRRARRRARGTTSLPQVGL